MRSAEPEIISASEIQSQLDRIVKEAFRGPSMMTRFLEYTVERTLAGDPDSLKESVIGVDACGRGANFDPRTDPIVRVTANRIRAKLDSYYAGPGLDDPVRIQYNPGSYVPVFTRAVREPAEPADAAPSAPAAVPAPPAQSPWRAPSWRLAAAVLAAVTLAAFLIRLAVVSPPDSALSQFRFQLAPPAGHPFETLFSGGPLALSADGAELAFTTRIPSQDRLLHVLSLSDSSLRTFPDAGPARDMFWSPDGKQLGFFSRGRLRVISREGAAGPVLCGSRPFLEDHGASWSPDGVIVLSPQPGLGLLRTAAAGGECTPLTTLGPDDLMHAWPHFLPDGRHFLYTAVRRNSNSSAIYAASLEAPDRPVQLLKAHSSAVYVSGRAVSGGALLYADAGSLWAIRFDASALRVSGDPWLVEEQVSQYAFNGVADISASRDGVLAFRTGPAIPERQLVWVSRNGKRESTPVATGILRYPRISPDGKQIMVERIDAPGSESSIWLFGVGAAQRRVTLDPGMEAGPVWSPDGKRFLYGRDSRLWLQDVESGVPARPLPGIAGDYPTFWSADGRRVAYSRRNEVTGWDVCLLDMTNLDAPKSTCPAATRFYENDGQLSPDGRWLAYRTNESGRYNVYLQRVDGKGEARLQISLPDRNAYGPRWRSDGRELYYCSGDTIMAVPVFAEPGGNGMLRLGKAEALFHAPFYAAAYGYAVSPDGSRFLFSVTAAGGEEDPRPAFINVALNRFVAWKPGR